jgi:hypothetical protein
MEIDFLVTAHGRTIAASFGSRVSIRETGATVLNRLLETHPMLIMASWPWHFATPPDERWSSSPCNILSNGGAKLGAACAAVSRLLCSRLTRGGAHESQALVRLLSERRQLAHTG